MNNGGLRRVFEGSGQLRRAGARPAGFTLVEIAIALIIVALLAGIALPSYTDSRNKAAIAQAKGDIADMAIRINQYYADHRAFPASLADIGKATLPDPWKHPYKYLALQGANVGQARKDKNLVPINSDFDLYSMGKDGKTVAPLTAKASQDDIIRANDGRFIGLASEY